MSTRILPRQARCKYVKVFWFFFSKKNKKASTSFLKKRSKKLLNL